MNRRKKLLLMPGDGIGPEVVGAARTVLEWLKVNLDLPVDFTEELIGGASIEAHGTPLTDAAFENARQSDAILLGCVGSPKWDFADMSLRPGYGLLKLRKGLELFANLRPVRAYGALTEQSSLRPEIVTGVDLVIVRELIGGIYFGEPRGIEGEKLERRGYNTLSYSAREIRRIARCAFDLARTRRSKVCSVDKANVLEAGQVWREEVAALHSEEYPDLELTHMFVDNCAMQLIRAPRQFDVILTDNMFGDILSDSAAMITGSLGLLPSASLGGSERCKGLFEPVHGSAPDIAGQGVSNPYGTLLSLEMLFRSAFGMPGVAGSLEAAISQCLADGVLTKDIARHGQKQVLTSGVAKAVIARLEGMNLKGAEGRMSESGLARGSPAIVN